MGFDTEEAVEFLERLLDGIRNQNSTAEALALRTMYPKTIPPDLAEFNTDFDELCARRNFMVSRGYRFCSIPACNCNSWHGGRSEARLQELDDLLDRYGVDHNGQTLHDTIEGVIRSAGYQEDRT